MIGTALLSNSSLKRLILDHNPLGATAVRLLLKNIDKRRCKKSMKLVDHLREISFDGCNSQDLKIGQERFLSRVDAGSQLRINNPMSFDPDNPTAHYCLRMDDPFQKSIAIRLLEMARDAPGENIKNVRLGKEMKIPAWHEMPAGKQIEVVGAKAYAGFDETDPALELPEEGVLEFDFYEIKRLPTEEKVVLSLTVRILKFRGDFGKVNVMYLMVALGYL